MKKLITHLTIFLFVIYAASVAEVKAQNRKSVSGAEVTGTFRAKGGNEFSILALGKGKLRVAFIGVYSYKMANGEDMANTGEAFGTAEIEGDTAFFSPEETEDCTITLKFLIGGKLQVKQEGSDADCGFGHNVFADGLYKKISGKKPKFDQND